MQFGLAGKWFVCKIMHKSDTPRGVHHAESGGGDGVGGGDEGAEDEAGLPVERSDETVGENGDADDGEGDENASSSPPKSGMSREEIPK